MLRNILRTSRWLARQTRQINTLTPVLLRQHVLVKTYSSPVIAIRSPASTDSAQIAEVDPVVYEEICTETLESLCDYFEEIVEGATHLKGADIMYSDGVLTVALGNSYGTYVINRQSPNKQIWLSSPVSGPKRYDLILQNGGYWVYKHDGVTLHQLLQTEISKIVESVDFKKCAHSA
ncbi:frataxin homolog, mitochondrial [Cydia splendana]|uniref:frataxin homolog, mitochondrial n=1 Tax=Cydia splendana TaxID=1100963 RepID=UPI0021253154